MDSQRELPPPSFYLSTIKTGQLWLFSDVPIISEGYRSTLNIQPLPGMNAPYVSQGYGSGLAWSFEAKLNAWNKFLASEARSSGRDPGANVYDEYLAIKKFIDDNGPSPLMLFHAPKRDAMVVALQSLDSEIALQEDVPSFGGADAQMPSTIPVSITLMQVPEYRVEFN